MALSFTVAHHRLLGAADVLPLGTVATNYIEEEWFRVEILAYNSKSSKCKVSLVARNHFACSFTDDDEANMSDLK